jgi:hypothetical protein
MSPKGVDGGAVRSGRPRRRAMAVGQGAQGGYAVPAAYDVGSSKARPAPKPKKRPRRKPSG